MAKTIKVWSGTEWVNVGIMAAIPPDYVTQADLIQRKKEVSESVASHITAQPGYRYFVDTTSERTITLPANPSLGDEVQIFDSYGTAGTHNITINRNNKNINGVAENAIIDVDKAAAVLIYTGSTLGWRLG
jgi:hypothetical protein